MSGTRTTFTEALWNSRAALSISAQPGEQGETLLYRELIAAAAQGSSWARSGIIGALSHPVPQTPATQAIVEQMFGSASDAVRSAAVHILITHGDIRGLRGFVEQEDVWFGGGRGAQLSQSVASFFRSPSPAGIATLAQGVKVSKYRESKIACAAALAWIHTRDALPHLAALLDSSDRTLVSYGVGGLAMFANGTPIGSSVPGRSNAPYRSEVTLKMSAMDETLLSKNPAILDYWRNWWRQNSATLLSGK